MTGVVNETDPAAGRRRFALLSWVALLVVLLATAAVVGAAFSKQKVAARERGELDAAGRLTTRLAEVDAAEWKAIGRRDVGSVRALYEARERLATAHGAIELDRRDLDRALDAAYAKYERALDVETQLLADQNLEQALLVDRTQVDPAYDAFREAADATARSRATTADRASATARRLTWVAAGLGVLTLFLLLGQLVTQRRLLSRERRHLEELQGLDRLKDEFVASVSHELRTPLTSIRGYLELVLEGEAGELTPQQREFLGVIDRNSNRLLHLVGDLLDVAQIEAGRLALEVTDQELTQFVAESVQAARPVAADRGIELNLHQNGEAHVRADRTRLAQVMDNLLSNALKFTDAGGQVDVRLETSNGTAVVEVSDTGMGISAPELTQLFQRFSRTQSAGKQGIPGSGLGLWISKAIVEAHGGEITVESAVGRGTTFRVALPTMEGQP